jgi:excisionase family DNA binding protein
MRLVRPRIDRVRLLAGHLTADADRQRMISWGGKPWLTRSEVAGELGLSADTVRRLIKERRLRAIAITVGRRVTLRVRRTDLDAFLHVYVKDTSTDDWE